LVHLCFAEGNFTSLYVPRSVESFGKSCFSEATVRNITFEAEGRLARNEESCFAKASPGSICLPRSVEVLGNSSFSDATVESLVFEAESRLTIL
jgi:hypothetical protein